MAAEPNGSHALNTTSTPPPPPTLDPMVEKAMKIDDFYRTYDVMTGVRIAATLGGFFGLMVILVLYKSKSKTEKALEDPDFTAAAVADAEEEEERELVAVLEATAYQQLNPRRPRRSLDTSSMPHQSWRLSLVGGLPPRPHSRLSNSIDEDSPPPPPRCRFSSVGGYSSFLDPPMRPHSKLAPFIDDDEDADSPPEYDDVYYNGHLDVPRRPSNITCSSSGSSYLERRDSAVALGLPVLPDHRSHSKRRQSSPLLEIYDFYYPIDIKVIQPTPGGSPCGSDRTLHAQSKDPSLAPRLAPLASISSCNSSLGGPDFTEMDAESCASDSVFHMEDPDTDDEVDQFSTDSDASEAGACYHRRKKKVVCESLASTPVNERPASVKSSKSSVTFHENPDISLSDSVRRSSTSSSLRNAERKTTETLF